MYCGYIHAHDFVYSYFMQPDKQEEEGSEWYGTLKRLCLRHYGCGNYMYMYTYITRYHNINHNCVVSEPNWMPVPEETIPGCPPGLEYLTKIDQLLVHQQIELFEGTLFGVHTICMLMIMLTLLWSIGVGMQLTHLILHLWAQLAHIISNVSFQGIVAQLLLQYIM